MEKRIIRKGDKIVFTRRTGHRIKNLTPRRVYEVVQEPDSYTRGDWSPDAPAYVSNVHVQNDRGLVTSYSIRNFVLPEGIVTCEAGIAATRTEEFFSELRSL